VHPELFELKALVAGRLDAHRRREIDDHLGSCADCSRHYVALMLGSSSPKTAEAEARQGLVPTGAAAVAAAGPLPSVTSFGIDAPLAPAEPRIATRQPHNNMPALETEFASGGARAPQPVSASLVDAIARLRAESDAPKAGPAAQTPTPVTTPQVTAAAPVETPLIEPSIFAPTPPDGVSIVQSRITPPASPELPGFMTRPVSSSPARGHEAQPELVVTFSSTPSRLTSYRTPSTLGAVASTASFEYVSQAVPTSSTAHHTEFSIEETTVAKKPKPVLMGAVLGGAALVLLLGIAGYRYFQSSVSQAAAAAAAAAAKQVQAQAQAARTAAPSAPTTATPPAPAPVQTRIVYVREPNRSNRNNTETRQGTDAPAPATTAPGPAGPVSVTLPDVNVSTGAEGALQANTQRSATSELTRSARATATRTAAPRP
jgi:hypothetical protein